MGHSIPPLKMNLLPAHQALLIRGQSRKSNLFSWRKRHCRLKLVGIAVSCWNRLGSKKKGLGSQEERLSPKEQWLGSQEEGLRTAGTAIDQHFHTGYLSIIGDGELQIGSISINSLLS